MEEDIKPFLTPGTVNRILNGEDLSEAKVQVLSYHKYIPYEKYSIVISDGNISSRVFLDRQLNSLIINQELEKFTIIEVHRCINTKINFQNITTLLNLSVVIPGDCFEVAWGNPVEIFKISEATERAAVESESTSISQMVTSRKSEDNMAIKLTPGSAKRILNEDRVTGVVVQFLNYEKLRVSDESYLINISDGDSNCYVHLDVQLNSLINTEMDKFSIIRIDECIRIHVKENMKLTTIKKLTVLTSGAEIGRILENPINHQEGSRDTAKEIVTEPEGTAVSQMTRDCSVNPKLVALPELTAASMKMILSGKNVRSVVMQVLGYTKVSLGEGIENYSYRLLLSDGGTCCSYVVLDKKFKSLIASKKLETFTIIRIHKLGFEKEKNRKIAIIYDLTILIPGAEVGAKVGNPVHVSATVADGTAMDIPNTHQRKMLPNLTAGSIKWILNGDKVYEAVMQVLACKPYSFKDDLVNKWFRLQISDGVNCYSFVMLNMKYNHLVYNKELELFTIISIQKCICKLGMLSRKTIIITDLTILTAGSVVGERLGNPVNICTSADTGTEMSSSDTHRQITLPKLTTGSIQWIYNGDDVPEPVVQVLNCKKMSGTDHDWYEIFLCDGYHICPFAKLDTKLNSLVENKELEKFTIIRVDKYVYNQEPGPKVIHLLDLTVLTPGPDVGKKLKYF